MPKISYILLLVAFISGIDGAIHILYHNMPVLLSTIINIIGGLIWLALWIYTQRHYWTSPEEFTQFFGRLTYNQVSSGLFISFVCITAYILLNAFSLIS